MRRQFGERDDHRRGVGPAHRRIANRRVRYSHPPGGRGAERRGVRRLGRPRPHPATIRAAAGHEPLFCPVPAERWAGGGATGRDTRRAGRVGHHFGWSDLASHSRWFADPLPGGRTRRHGHIVVQSRCMRGHGANQVPATGCVGRVEGPSTQVPTCSRAGESPAPRVPTRPTRRNHRITSARLADVRRPGASVSPAQCARARRIGLPANRTSLMLGALRNVPDRERAF